MAARHAGPEAVSLLSTYWACGDLEELTEAVSSRPGSGHRRPTVAGVARFASAEELVATEVESTPLIERISEHVYASIRAEANEVLRPFVTAAGTLDAPLVGHLVAGDVLVEAVRLEPAGICACRGGSHPRARDPLART